MLKIEEENDFSRNEPKKEGNEKICLKGEILGIAISFMEIFKSVKILRGCKEGCREVERKSAI